MSVSCHPFYTVDVSRLKLKDSLLLEGVSRFSPVLVAGLKRLLTNQNCSLFLVTDLASVVVAAEAVDMRAAAAVAEEGGVVSVEPQEAAVVAEVPLEVAEAIVAEVVGLVKAEGQVH